MNQSQTLNGTMDARNRVAEIVQYVYEYLLRFPQEKNSVDFLHTPIAAFLVLHDLRSIHVDMEWVKDAEKCRRAGVSPMPWETFQKLRSEKTQHMPIFTLAFVLLLILIFIVDIGLNNWNIKGSRIMVQIGEFRISRIIQHNEWYRLLTGAFLHADYSHLGYNITRILLNGTILEWRHGTAKIALLSFISKIGSGLFTAILNPSRRKYDYGSLGASGISRALVGMAFADICINWDTLTMRIRFSNLYAICVPFALLCRVGFSLDYRTTILHVAQL